MRRYPLKIGMKKMDKKQLVKPHERLFLRVCANRHLDFVPFLFFYSDKIDYRRQAK